MAHLISTTDLKRDSYISKNVDDTLISTLISRVQDTMIESILGSKLFNRLLQGIDASDLNPDEILLLNTYIHPCMVAGVEIRAVDMTTIELRQTGASKVSSDGVNPASEGEMNSIQNSLRKDFSFYRERLITFLKLNYTSYPEYISYYQQIYTCDENGQILPDKGRTDINIVFI